MDDDWWTAPLRSVFAGRRLVLAGASAAAWTEHIAVLRAVGVSEILVVANARGAGRLPDVTTVVVEAPRGLSMMEQIRADERFLADPPADVRAALEEFDPDGTALVLGTFLNTNSHLVGRPFVSHRRAEWVALEDKVVIDAFWDRAGIERQPSVVVPLTEAANVAGTVDQGAGTVWAADARDGFHGGASQTYWVADAASRRVALDGLTPVCDRVRVMPFIDGIACSIHGIVLPDGVAVLRPVEMVTLRRGHEFAYAGCATYWDPPIEIREQMRSIARLAGGCLVEEVDFHGTFTVDGVAAPDGFWPTELNPRFGAGIHTIARASGLPILLINELVAGGHEIGRSAGMIEEELTSSADAHRGGGTWMAGLSHNAEPGIRQIAVDAGTWAWSDGTTGATTVGTVTIGASSVRCVWDPAAVPIGPSTADLACQFWRFVDREYRTDLGPLTPPPDLRHPR